MTDLMAELAELAKLRSETTSPQDWTHEPWEDDRCYSDNEIAALNYIVALVKLDQAHHATLTRIIESESTIRADYDALVIRLEAAERDAERWRSLGWAEAPMVTVTGSQLARGIRPGDFAVPWDWPVTSNTKVRLIAMHNSAREG